MNGKRFSIAAFVLVAGFALIGCQRGPEGPLGPSGPQGSPGTPAEPSKIYYYNNRFDSVANVNEWQASLTSMPCACYVSASLDSSKYLSYGYSMKVSASANSDSILYTPFTYAGGKIGIEGAIDISSMPVAAGFNYASLVIVHSGQIRAAIGYYPGTGTGGNFYAIVGGVPVNIYGSPNPGYFHTLKAIWDDTSNTADYYVDGYLVGQGFGSAASFTFGTAPTSYAGVHLRTNGNWTMRLDNFQIYHY